METHLHLTVKSDDASDIHKIRKCLTLLISIVLLVFFITLPQVHYAQSGLCESAVPFEIVDLSSSASATWTSPIITRTDLCCSYSSPENCLEFEITLHPNSTAINFEIISGTIPSGDLFYQINCGLPIPVGTPVCLSSIGPHTLTFCNPETDANTYLVSSIPASTISFMPNNPYICENDSIELSVSGANTYLWAPATGLSATTGANIIAFPTSPTTYNITATDIYGCTSTNSITVEVCDAPSLVTEPGGDICIGESFQLEANGALFYEWTPAGSLNDANISNPVATPTVTTEYVVTGYDATCTVIQNGDFSNGNTGFTTAYNYSTNLYPEGNYMIGTNPNDYHSNFSHCGDHTTGSENFMIVNGNTVANQEVWCQNIHVNPNTDYLFSTWITSVHPSNPAILQFSINGTLLGSPFGATATTCEWNEFYETWNSGSNTSIQICIVNQNTIANGNDFAIDDIYFAPLCSAKDTVEVIVHNPPIINFLNVGPFCETDAASNIIADPTGGTWSGTGITDVNNGTFDPSIAGDGNYTIFYSYNDGYCQVDTSITIHVDAVVDATIMPVGPFCETDAAVVLNAVSPGGTWSGTGVVGNNFDPNIADAGDHIITYNVINGACSDTDTKIIHVDAVVNATITPVGPFCETDAAVVLNAVSLGGTWSGTGVVGNTFDPIIAGAGDHIITYNVINGACSDTDTETIHVDAVVNATITPVGPFCETDAA
ncbi:MAG: hypothetical protein PHW82_04625, partial [Bacteroidales bacterium]|nr:hypothetical protein [Bacteroidales bacterium]